MGILEKNRKFSAIWGAEFLRNFEFGAVQKCVHLVDLEKCCKMSTKFGFGTAENEPRQILQFSAGKLDSNTTVFNSNFQVKNCGICRGSFFSVSKPI